MHKPESITYIRNGIYLQYHNYDKYQKVKYAGHIPQRIVFFRKWVSQKAYEAVQKEEQSTASSENASSSAEDKKNDDDVIDAEYTKE